MSKIKTNTLESVDGTISVDVKDIINGSGTLQTEGPIIVDGPSSSIGGTLNLGSNFGTGYVFNDPTSESLKLYYYDKATSAASLPLTLGRNNTLTFGGGKVWNQNNDGSGSGLDADLLDGKEGSYYQGLSNTAYAQAEKKVAKSNGVFSNMPKVGSYLMIDSGSSSSGTWVRFNDGTMICNSTQNFANVSAVSGSIFSSSGESSWNFPIPFVGNVPTVYGSDKASTNVWVVGRATSSTAHFKLMSFASSTSSRTIVVTAIGRWK